MLLPAKPSNGADNTRGQLGRLLDADAGAGRLLATTISAPRRAGRAVYVHAKIGGRGRPVAHLGSANLNEHSCFNDTEMNVLTCDPALARQTRLRLWSEHTERPVARSKGSRSGDRHRVAATVQEQAGREREGQPRTHRLALLESVSRRTDRLQGPMRGLLVDG